jgi:predicted nucleotide-binding protein
MASRKSAEPPKSPPELTVRLDEAKARFTRQIEEGDAFVSGSRTDPDEFDTRYNVSRELLVRSFSNDFYATEFDGEYTKVPGARLMYIGPGVAPSGPTPAEKAKPFVSWLKGLVKRLEYIPEATTQTSQSRPTTQPERAQLTGPIFIVHGHDDGAKNQVMLLVQQAGLQAIVLHQQPNAGRTIIQKFEGHGGAAAFAIVVATPDDVGAEKLATNDHKPLNSRARQNVIAEMGWFAGRLSRARVCVLKKGEIEMPSDFGGVAYTEMDDQGAWKVELARELKAAGYDFDWSKALS